jgi:hypothetical protein
MEEKMNEEVWQCDADWDYEFMDQRAKVEEQMQKFDDEWNDYLKSDSNFILCRDCPNFVRESNDSKTGRCEHNMPRSILSEDSGCLGGAGALLVI